MNLTQEQLASLAEVGRQYGMIGDPDALRLLDLSAVTFRDGKPVAPYQFWRNARDARPDLFPGHAKAMTDADFKSGMATMQETVRKGQRAADDARDLARIANQFAPKA